jgi:Ulp1 family protease
MIYFCSLEGSDIPQKVKKYLCRYLLNEYQDKHLGPSLDEDSDTRKQKLEYHAELQKLESSKPVYLAPLRKPTQQNKDDCGVFAMLF